MGVGMQHTNSCVVAAGSSRRVAIPIGITVRDTGNQGREWFEKLATDVILVWRPPPKPRIVAVKHGRSR